MSIDASIKKAFLIEASSMVNAGKAESAIYKASPDGLFWRRYPNMDFTKVTLVAFDTDRARERFDQFSDRKESANRIIAERSAGARLTLEEYKCRGVTTKFATLIS